MFRALAILIAPLLLTACKEGGAPTLQLPRGGAALADLIG